MDFSPDRRRTVALVAAYALALQTLLAAFVPAALAAPADSVSVLCSHDASGPGKPAQHDQPCAAMCAAMGHGIAGPLPSGMAASITLRSTITALIPASDWVPPQIAVIGSHAPRGPPRV
jgi:hypothetical protein